MPFDLSVSREEIRPGRKRGAHGPNRKHVLMRDSLERAYRELGAHKWLVEVARGSTQGAAAVIGLLSKLIPAELRAELDVRGGVDVLIRAYVRVQAEQHQVLDATHVPLPLDQVTQGETHAPLADESRAASTTREA